MLVRDYMTLNPITVKPEDSVGDALKLLKDHSIRRLPVVTRDGMVGIVTEQDLLKASPSAATSLSVWEINYLFPKIKIKDIMTKDIITVSPDAVLEEAALIMRENNISSLPVMIDGKLMGIITESDIFKALIDVFGFNVPSVRLTLSVQDEVGTIKKISETVSSLGLNIISLIVQSLDGGRGNIILRLSTDDITGVVAAFRNKNIEVSHIN
ncbi:MAG: CBS and ACT domain-containing protein [Bacillota bacterium]